MDASFERKLFDLVQYVSSTTQQGSFSSSLAHAIQDKFGDTLRVRGTCILRLRDGKYETEAITDPQIWPLIDTALSARHLHRRLKGQPWWVRRGIKLDIKDGTEWYDLILVPVDPELQHVLGLLTESLAGEEGQGREAGFRVLAQLVRLAVDRYHQHARLNEILTLAREQQLSLLQPQLPFVANYHVAVLSIPAEEVGGDYHQLVPLTRSSFAVAVGDAKGKGFEAAILATGLHAALKTVTEVPFKVAHKVGMLNRSLFQRGEMRNLVSLFYAEFEDEGRLIYVNSSHPPPIVVHANGMAELSAGGVFLGLDINTTYRIGVWQLNPGDILVIYTDGWTEVFNDQNEEFGPERMREALKDMHGANPQAVVDRIQQACDAFRGEQPYRDDRTLLILRRN